MLIEAKELSFRYDRNLPWVLQDINLAFYSEISTSLFAPSGYGKSTLAMLLSGYYKPSRGQVLLDGKALPETGICPVQLVFQHPEKAINPRWKLRKVLEESGNMQPEVLRAFGIELPWLDRYPRELSGGELQRFCVARAIMSGAEFLICDEISTMLDVITQAQIWNVIIELAKEKHIGLINVTHNLKLAERISDKIYDLSKGEFI